MGQLTTYESWDDPPSTVPYYKQWVKKPISNLPWKILVCLFFKVLIIVSLIGGILLSPTMKHSGTASSVVRKRRELVISFLYMLHCDMRNANDETADLLEENSSAST